MTLWHSGLLAQTFAPWYDSPVAYNKIWKKRACLVLLAYAALAFIGSSAISAGEAFCVERPNDDSLSSGRYFSDSIVGWLAGNVLTIRKAHSDSSSLSRGGLLREVALAGTIAIAMYLAGGEP